MRAASCRPRLLFVQSLPGSELDVVFALRRELYCIGARRHATAATVEADRLAVTLLTTVVL